MSYGNSIAYAMPQMAYYVARILRGEKVSALHVQQATKMELIINLKTAKGLGLTVRPALLARADEVIE
jgi:putative ABC transport system substrate-binding protein